MSLYLLGPPRIESDGEPIDVDTRKATGLLVYLALTREPRQRAALANLLWPELDRRWGRAALRQYEECVQTLHEQLCAPPQASTIALYEEIRSGRLSGPAPQIAREGGAEPGPDTAPLSQAVPSAGGQKRLLTVLCADVNPTFQRSGAPSPEEEAELIARFLELVQGALHAYGGQSVRVAGLHAIVAFGLQQTHQSDAERALRAALAIRQRSIEAGLAVRIGINSGESFAQESAPQAIAGSVVEQAMRLSKGGAPGQIRVGEITYQLIRHLFAWRAAAEEERPAYCLDRLLARPRKALEIDGQRLPLVGRDEE